MVRSCAARGCVKKETEGTSHTRIDGPNTHTHIQTCIYVRTNAQKVVWFVGTQQIELIFSWGWEKECLMRGGPNPTKFAHELNAR